MVVVAAGRRPARVDVLLLLSRVVCHAHIVANTEPSGDTGGLL
jgi:hypothetical protein